MADEPNPTPGETPDPKPGETPSVPPPAPAGETPPEDEEPYDKARAMALITRQRTELNEARKQAKELKELRERLQALDDAKLSETEKLTKRVAEMESAQAERDRELQELRTERAVATVASGQQVQSTDALLKLMDRSALEFDANGLPTNAEEIVKQTIRAYPFLVGSGSAATNGARGSTTSETDAERRRRLLG